MLKGSPFPKFHAKAAESKGLQPVSDALMHFRDQDPAQEGVFLQMVAVLNASVDIDALLDGTDSCKLTSAQANRLERLVMQLNVGTTKLCQAFRPQGIWLFNFVPKNHYVFHLAMLGRHMSPKLVWCYMGEDLMDKVKKLAQGSFRGTYPKNLGNKVIGKYLVALSLALSSS